MEARVSELDGLRGIAVAAVVAFHLGYLEGGYLGVDLFFVLSGFLITGLLLKRGPAEPGALSDFWQRRVRRIVPALALLIGAICAYTGLVADEATRFDIRDKGVAAIFWLVNWHDITTADSYWDLFDAPSATAHLWSLAVEMQLYLLWPVVVVWAFRRGGTALVGRIALVAAASSAALAVFLSANGSSLDRVYLGTDTRAAALLLGAAAACYQDRRRSDSEPLPRIPDVAALPVIAVIALMWFGLDGRSDLLGRGALGAHSAASAVLVLAVSGGGSGWPGRALRWGPLVGLGKISYGVYLWHWPAIVWLDSDLTGLDGAALVALQLGATLSVSLLSWTFLETPILRRQSTVGKTLGTTLATTTFLGLLLVGATWGAREPTRTLDTGETSPDDPRPTALVVGDSLALNLSTAISSMEPAAPFRLVGEVYPGCTLVDRGTEQLGPDGMRDAVGCGPHSDAEAALAAGVARADPDLVIVIFALPDVPEHESDGQMVHACVDGGGSLRDEQLDELVRAAGDVPVMFLTTPVPGEGKTGEVAQTIAGLDPDILEDRIVCHNAALSRLAERYPQSVTLLDLADRTCPMRPCPAGDEARRPDGVHLAGDALSSAAGWVAQEADDLLHGRDGG